MPLDDGDQFPNLWGKNIMYISWCISVYRYMNISETMISCSHISIKRMRGKHQNCDCALLSVRERKRLLSVSAATPLNGGGMQNGMRFCAAVVDMKLPFVCNFAPVQLADTTIHLLKPSRCGFRIQDGILLIRGPGALEKPESGEHQVSCAQKIHLC